MNENDLQKDLNNLANNSLADLKDDGVLNSSNSSENKEETLDANDQGRQTSNEGIVNKDNVVSASTTLPSEVPSLEEKPKKKKSKIVLALIVLLVVASCVFVGYQFLVIRNSKNVITSSISKVFDYASKSITEIDNAMLKYDLKKDVLKSSGTIQVDTDYELLKDLKNVVFDYGASIDLNNEKFYVALGAKENDKDVINGKIYLDSDRLTLDSNILDNPYYVNLEDELDLSEIKSALDELPSLNMSDYNILINKVKKAVLNTIDEKKITNQSDKINIRGKEVNVLTHVYNIDGAETVSLLKAIFESLCEDDSLEILASMTRQDKSKIKSSLESNIKNLDNDKEKKDTITLKIYADTLLGSFRGFDISFKESDKMALELQYVTDGSKGNFMAVLPTVDLNCTDLDCENVNTNTIQGTVDYSNVDKTLKISTEYKELKIDLTYQSKNALSKYISFKAAQDENLIDVVLDFDVNKNGDSLVNNGSVSLNYKNKENHLNATVKMNGTSSVGGSVEQAPNKALNYENMTVDDLEGVLNNFEKALSNSSLKNIFDQLSNLNKSSSKEDFRSDYLDLLEAAQLKATLDQMNGATFTSGVCYDLASLTQFSKYDDFDYSGSVLVTNTNGKFSFQGWLSNEDYIVEGKGSNLKIEDIKDSNYDYASSTCGQ